MSKDYSLSPPDSKRSSRKWRQTNRNSQFQLARVLDVIVDESHPEYQALGGSLSLGAIKYKLLGSKTDELDTEGFPTAYPLNASLRQLPLKNEIVFIVEGPSEDLEVNTSNRKKFYHSIVSIWNHPQHNIYPSDTDIQFPDLGPDIDKTPPILERDDIQKLHPFPGDVILDGRNGQSIRFSGYNHPKNILGDLINQGKPLTYIVNGRKSGGDDPTVPVIEDINQDDSSIILTSDHVVPLEQSATKYDTYVTPPSLANQYRGKQVIVSSGRLFFNSTEENIALSAFTSVSMTAGRTINLDAETYIGLDAPVILLGTQLNINKESRQLREYRFREPVVLGNQLEEFLNDLLDIVDSLAVALSDARTKEGSPLGLLQETGAGATTLINTLLRPKINPGKVSKLKSKKIFVE